MRECMFVYMYMHVQVHTHVCTCMWRPKVDVRCLLHFPPHFSSLLHFIFCWGGGHTKASVCTFEGHAMASICVLVKVIPW